MDAIVLEQFGSPLVSRDVPTPVPRPGEVLVRVVASSVNPADLAIAAGHLRDVVPHELPLVMGRDVAGIVEAVGAGVTDLAPGDEVLGFVLGPVLDRGAWATHVRVPAGSLTRKPAALPWALAGALPLAGASARATVDAVAPREGDTVLVVGATGAVGQLAVQLAAMRGARVLATGMPEDAARLRLLGAEALVDRRDDLEVAVRRHAPEGVDAAIDLVRRGPDLDVVASLVRHGGRLASLQMAADVERCAGKGVRATNVFASSEPSVLAALARDVVGGALQLPLQATVPLAGVDEAMALLARGGVRGKIGVLVDAVRSRGPWGLPPRRGVRPRTSGPRPHEQLDERAARSLQDALARRVFALPDVVERPTLVSAAGARALWLDERVDAPPGALLRGREMGHFHPWDGSMHLAVPDDMWLDVVAAGWGEQHPIARLGGIRHNVLMLYGPRNEEEVGVLAGIVRSVVARASGAHAHGPASTGLA